jgi:HlyD family secretion protein
MVRSPACGVGLAPQALVDDVSPSHDSVFRAGAASPKTARPAQLSAPGLRPKKLLHAMWVILFIVAGVAVATRSSWLRRHEAPRYRTAVIDRGPIAAKVTANGTLSALVTVSVGSQVSGRIESLAVDFGSKVTKGQVIATLDPALFRAAAAQAAANHRAAQAALQRARAQLENAERQQARASALRGEGVMTGVDYDSATAALRVARADVEVATANVAQTRAGSEQAELNLRYTTIISPIDGVVLSRNVDIGQTVAAALQAPTLFTIARDLTEMQVDTNVPEADVGKIRAGMPVTFSVDAYPEQTFTGVVRQLRDNAQTIQNVVTYDAVVDVSNTRLLLAPGMTANVTFTYRESPAALRVPNAALRFQPDAPLLVRMQADAPPPSAGRDVRTVWLLRSGAAHAAVLRIGITDGTQTEILSGEVSPGDEVIVEAMTDEVKHG